MERLVTMSAPVVFLGPCTELPYAPSNVRISEITATSVHISWHYDGPPSEAVEFVIQYKPKLAVSQDYSEITGLKTNYYTVQNLSSFTEYEFYVVAVSAIGRGLASTATFVTTGETGTAKTLTRLPLSDHQLAQFCVTPTNSLSLNLLTLPLLADPSFGGPSKYSGSHDPSSTQFVFVDLAPSLFSFSFQFSSLVS